MNTPKLNLIQNCKNLGMFIVVISWLNFAQASDSFFNPDTPVGVFLSKNKITIQIEMVENDASELRFTFVSDPREKTRGKYLRPYALKSEARFWEFFGEQCELKRESKAFDVLYSRKFDLESSVLTLEMSRMNKQVSSPDFVSIKDFEKPPFIYDYLGRAFRNDIIDMIKEAEEAEDKEMVRRLFS